MPNIFYLELYDKSQISKNIFKKGDWYVCFKVMVPLYKWDILGSQIIKSNTKSSKQNYV